MLQVAIRAASGTLIFREWGEARALWDRVVARLPVAALVLMPDQVHAVIRAAGDRPALSEALDAFAQWRNRARHERGPVFEQHELLTPVRGAQHALRACRDVHLAPCRRGLAADPLAWPFSTHRDAVGLALPPALRRRRDAPRFHRLVSADPSCRIDGTPFPGRAGPERLPAPDDILAAVSALTRTTLDVLRRRGPARTLLVDALLALTGADAHVVADIAELSAGTVRARRRAAPPRRTPEIAIVARVAGDPRFGALRDGDLRESPAWAPYRDLL